MTSGVPAVAWRVFGARRHPGLARLRGALPGLPVPLSTLHGPRYRGARLTRGQRGWRGACAVGDWHSCTCVPWFCLGTPRTPGFRRGEAAGARHERRLGCRRLPGKGTGYPAPSPQTRTCAMNASGSSVASSLRQWLTKQATPRLAHNCADPGPARCCGGSWVFGSGSC